MTHLGNAAKRLAEIAAAAQDGHLQLVLVDVVDLVGGGEHLTLVDVIDAASLKNLSLNEVTDAGLRNKSARREK
eukprot:7489614-Pyramimonas_sp.AAC.1